jgi:uncharacterized coiled-coil protein SlyX
MEQIKKGYFLQYWRELIIIVMAVALLLLPSQCEPDDIKADKKELNKVLDGVKVIQAKHKKLVDSLKQEDAKKDAKIAELETDNTRQETIIAENKKQLKNKQKEIAKYTYQQSAQYLAERYNTKAVSAEGSSVVLKDSIPNKVISELVEKDVLVTDVKNYNKIIDNKSSQIKLGEEKLLNKSLELASKDLETKELEKGLNLSLDLNKKTEKENKKLKRNNTLKTFAIIGASVAGFSIGKGVTK